MKLNYLVSILLTSTIFMTNYITPIEEIKTEYATNTEKTKNKIKRDDNSISISKKTYIMAKIDTPIYDNRRGSLDHIATLKKDEVVQVIEKYGSNWWKIKWANTYAYISKETVVVVNTKKYKNDNLSMNSSKKNIITLEDNIPVYDNTNGELVAFVMLKKDHRYPYILKTKDWWKIDMGGRYGFVHHSKVKEDSGVAILMYHHILDERELGSFKGQSSTITTEQFAKEMEFLHENGYGTVTINELEKYIKGKINLPPKTVIITFDDGLRSVKENAYPILKEYNMKATEYIITGRNKETVNPFNPTILQYFSKKDLTTMKDVFNYQGHTHDLHQLTKKNKSFLLEKSKSYVKNDLKINKNILKSTSFSYPYGQYNQNIIQMLKELGYTNAVTIKEGKVHPGDDVFQLKRQRINQMTTIDEFEKKVSF